jgi:hypothetical protein
MSKIIKLPYNGEVGWDATASQIHEFYKINQDVNDWLKSKDDNGVTNKQKILDAYDDATKERGGFIDKKGEKTDKSVDDINGSWPVRWPIILHVESSKLQRDILPSQSNLLLVDSGGYNFGPRQVGEGESEEQDNFVFSAQIGRITQQLRSETEFLDVNAWLYYNGHSQSHFRNEGNKGSTMKHYQQLRVWVWCKALASLSIREMDSPVESSEFNKFSVIDLTPFLMNLSVNQTEQAGSFSLTLPPVIGTMPCTLDLPTGVWQLDETSYVQFMNSNIVNYTFKSAINWQMSEANKQKIRDLADAFDATTRPKTYGQRAQATQFDTKVNLYDQYLYDSDRPLPYPSYWWFREDFFFHNVISENDIVFIGGLPYGEDEPKYTHPFLRNVDDIVKQHNMQIALVDTNSISATAESTDITIQIAGRDLMKLLIEDGSFFFQKSYANPKQVQTAFNNVDLPRRGDDVNAFNKASESGWKGVNRLITGGMIESMYNVEARNVGYVMNLLISTLSNIEICQSKVFDSYGDLRTKFQVEIEEPVQNTEGVDENITE